MKLGKRKFTLFFVLCSIVVLVLGMSVFAAEYKQDALYIMSEECPDEALSFVKDNLYAYIYDLPDQDERYADINVSEIILGTPFTIQKENQDGSDLYYFSIMYENEIRFIMRVYKDIDGKYTGIFSEILAPELQAVTNFTSMDNPISLYMNNGNIMGTLSGNTFVFMASPMGNDVLDVPAVYSNDDVSVINAKEAISYDVWPIGDARAAVSKNIYRYCTMIKNYKL